MKRAIARVAMATLAGTMVLGATAAQAGVIKVGITLHMVTETGQKMGQMILDEFEEQNRLGGINGHQLEPILLNDECKSDKGVANMTRLVHQDRVHLVIGSTCSGVTLASMGIATKAEVPQITPHSTNATITMQGSEWIFRASISGRYAAAANPTYTAERVGTNIAYVYGSDAAGVGFIEKFQAFMKKHHDADPAYSAQVPEDALDVRTQLLQAKAANPEAILIAGLPAVSPRWYRQLDEVGWPASIPRFSGAGISNVSVPMAAGDSIVGAYFDGAYTGFDNRPIARLFNRMTGEKYGIPRPGQDLANAWDTSQIVFEALRRARLTLDDASLAADRTAIRDALASIRNYQGLASGPISFCEAPTPQCRDGNRTPVIMEYTKGGENFELKIIARPTMDIDTGLE